MIPVVTPLEARAADEAAEEPLETLIERAGTAVAVAAVRLLGGTYGRRITVIAGPGNNGADGRVAGRMLERRGARVTVVDARSCPGELGPADLVIDAAFGTGFRGDWSAPVIGSAAVLAVDIPSGVDALTGRTTGRCLPADVTVTFSAAKPGHLIGEGRRLTGRLEVADIGLDIPVARAGIVERSDVRRWWRGRAPDDHKWRHAVRVVAGSTGMTGAAALVASAAQRVGAGIVHLSTPGVDGSVGPVEVVQRLVDPVRWAEEILDDLERFGSMAIGPGLGRADHLPESVAALVARAPVPVVVDGDGLHALARAPGGAAAVIGRRSAPTILTPHDGEFADLTGAPVPPDRFAAVRELATTTGAIVLLKGPATLIAEPGGDVVVVDAGTEVLATAGSGDVLTGIIAGLLAGLLTEEASAADAAAAGAWIHARTTTLVARYGTVAGDLVAALPEVVETVAGRDTVIGR